jgi:hypothetical protein
MYGFILSSYSVRRYDRCAWRYPELHLSQGVVGAQENKGEREYA